MQLERLTLIGSGAAAWSLAAGLAGRGFSLRVWARRAQAAVELCEDASAAVAGAVALEPRPDLSAALDAADGVLLAVADAAIAEVADRVRDALPGDHRPAVLHTSGYHGVAPLHALRAGGCATGVLHPLRPLVRGVLPAWERTWFSLAGDGPAVAHGRHIVAELGAQSLVLGQGEEQHHAYHAGAALLSGGIVGLFDAALACFERAGLERESARAALVELATANLEHLRHLDPGAALTGPAVRGDRDVVAGHARALTDDPDLVQLYGATTRYLIALACARGALDADAAAAVRDALRGSICDPG